MRSFIKFLLSGFGTDTMAGKAVGIVILLLLSAIIIAYYVISYIWGLFNKNKQKTTTNP